MEMIKWRRRKDEVCGCGGVEVGEKKIPLPSSLKFKGQSLIPNFDI